MMNDSMQRIWEMVRKEFLQIFRDPRLARVLFIAPVIQLVVFGYAVSTDIRHTPTFVVDQDQTQDSRDLIDAFTASGYFTVVGRSQRPADLVKQLDYGDAIVGLQIPRNFSTHMRDGTGAKVQVLLDGTNSNTATVAQGYAQRIVQNFSLAHMHGISLPLDLRERAWFNPDLASRNYNVPAVIGAIIMLIGLLLTALAVVREREIGTLEQLMVSPLKRGELVAGKILPFTLIALVDMTVITAIALFWFHIPFVGNFFVLFLASVLYLLSVLGMGLWISTISNTQQEAFMTTFLVFMPTILLSGFLFPISSMPQVFQWITLINPLRHYLEIVRGVFLKGAGVSALWHQFVALLVLGAALISFAISRFTKTND